MYAWEAAQFVFYDFRLLCALMRGACPSALRVFARLRQRLPFISFTSRARRRSSVMHSENLELQAVPQRGAEHRSRIPTSMSEFDIGVGDALDHAADREDRPSPQPSPPSTTRPYPKEGREWTRLTFFRFCNLLAKFDYLLLRFTTFASLLALLILLDLPSQTGSASAAPGSRFSETLTCEEWKVINIVAWVSDRDVYRRVLHRLGISIVSIVLCLTFALIGHDTCRIFIRKHPTYPQNVRIFTSSTSPRILLLTIEFDLVWLSGALARMARLRHSYNLTPRVLSQVTQARQPVLFNI